MSTMRLYCKHCQAHTRHEKKDMVWGCGDLILVLLSFGAWAIIKAALSLLAPHYCSQCGARHA